ncbi:MAG: dihydrofolate reductase family protein [Gemmatimonadaceae bacterium]
MRMRYWVAKGLFVGGVKLPRALAELGLIDEYEFVVQPRLAGHGPTLFKGLSKHVDLKLVSRLEFGSRAVAMRYKPRSVRLVQQALRAFKDLSVQLEQLERLDRQVRLVRQELPVFKDLSVQPE